MGELKSNTDDINIEIQNKANLISIKKKLKRYIRIIRRSVNQVILIIANRIMCMIFKLKNNRILFLSDMREKLGGNLECLYNIIPDDKYVKVISTKADRRDKRSIKEKIKLTYNLSVSKYILLDDLSKSTSFIKIRKGQEFIQLWHGAGAFKTFGHSRSIRKDKSLKMVDLEHGKHISNRVIRKHYAKVLNININRIRTAGFPKIDLYLDGKKNLRRVHPGYEKYTKAITSSEEIRECYAEAFGIDISKIKAVGFPRTDMFFDKNYIDKSKRETYKKYPFLENKKVILFAPTYRGEVGGADYDFNRLNLDNIYNKYKDDYVFVFKWHPALYNNILRGIRDGYDLDKYDGFYYDLSEERDINDLLLVTDILITDYSSLIFDYAFINKPIIYFAYDLEDYEQGRGLYFRYEDYIYGRVAKTEQELIEAIETEDMAIKKRNKFMKKFLGACDGHSTEKTYEWIFNS